jgi:hypothetical protein
MEMPDDFSVSVWVKPEAKPVQKGEDYENYINCVQYSVISSKRFPCRQWLAECL